MNDRLETLIQKMQEALNKTNPTCLVYPLQYWQDLRAALRQTLAELPLIRDQYERKIAELEEIIATAEQGETN